MIELIRPDDFKACFFEANIEKATSCEKR